jgi:hypothetical protein
MVDWTQAMSWFSVGGNAGIALGPVIVTPILLGTRLHGTRPPVRPRPPQPWPRGAPR